MSCHLLSAALNQTEKQNDDCPPLAASAHPVTLSVIMDANSQLTQTRFMSQEELKLKQRLS